MHVAERWRRELERQSRCHPSRLIGPKLFLRRHRLPKKNENIRQRMHFPTKSMRVGRLQNFEKDKTGCFEGRRDELDL